MSSTTPLSRLALATLGLGGLAATFAFGPPARPTPPQQGVGINLAIQDAVAAANLLGPRLLRGEVRGRDLARVQRRRAWPARATQLFQLVLARRLVPSRPGQAPRPPLPLGVVRALPFLPHVTGRAIGIGLRPEHVRTL